MYLVYIYCTVSINVLKYLKLTFGCLFKYKRTKKGDDLYGPADLRIQLKGLGLHLSLLRN